ncbi:NADP oxidoreductase [Pseudodonghicola xiamenensis]|uniref:NADP oxidoreductase n=1 Tax=Pseudodonghicola xiamenensis TaxID=337702 RepID=A0A8J3ME64_9RHOB|nr:NADP oxidoreductase [Pseudodonghicola xiamenensis]
MVLKLAIVGSGLMGAKLGRLWARCGHEVTFSYSRSRAKLDRLAAETGGAAGSVADAVAGAEAVLFAVHWNRVEDALAQAGDLTGQVVLNCCVPLDASNTDLVLGPTTSGAEQLAVMRPRARWVACFNTNPSESFELVYARKGRAEPPQSLIYGDDAGAKAVARDLIRDIGFAPLEAGGLRTGRFVEPFAMVTAELAYGQPGGPALTYRFEKLRG